MRARTLFVAFAVSIIIGIAPAVAADPIEEFFKGKIIKIVVGASAGGAFEVNARVLGRHIGRHIPGNPTIIAEAMPGAGGSRANAFLYNAAPQDGSYWGAVLPPSIISPLLRPVKYDSAKFHWLGSITPMSTVTSVWHTAPAKTIEEAKKTPLIMASSSRLSNAYLVPALLNAAIGTRFTFVQGYAGGAPMNAAMEKGEVHGRVNYYNSYIVLQPHWIKGRQVIHLVQNGPRIKDLPNVPSMVDLMPTDEFKRLAKVLELDSDVGHGFFLPPRVPADRVAAIRKAFAATMRDPAYLAEAKERKLIVDPVSAEDVQKIIEHALSIPRETIEKFKKMVQLDADDGGTAKKKKKS